MIGRRIMMGGRRGNRLGHPRGLQLLIIIIIITSLLIFIIIIIILILILLLIFICYSSSSSSWSSSSFSSSSSLHRQHIPPHYHQLHHPHIPCHLPHRLSLHPTSLLTPPPEPSCHVLLKFDAFHAHWHLLHYMAIHGYTFGEPY